jgi:tRNA threonylcarbamoyladenosine biosynthesis protein TsaE
VKFDIPNRRAMTILGKRIAATLGAGDLVLLDGPLGSGKTFLARSILRGLGIDSETAITSPTFGLIHTYERDGAPILHVDLYRLRDGDLQAEVARLGLREARGDGAIILAEWADGALLGHATYRVVLTPTGTNTAREAAIDGSKLELLSALYASHS